MLDTIRVEYHIELWDPPLINVSSSEEATRVDKTHNKYLIARYCQEIPEGNYEY